MTGLIYTFTNKENGKEYVGQTIQPIEVRDYAHYYEAFNQNKGGKFNNALRKYGKYLDIFTDVHGNINLELLANAVKAEMKEKSADGFVVNILNKPVRFGEDDVNQLVEIFKTFKQNN